MLFSSTVYWFTSFFSISSIFLWTCCKSIKKKKPKATKKKKLPSKKASTPNEIDPKTAEELDASKQPPEAQKKRKLPIVPPLPPATYLPLIIPDDKSTINVTLETTDADISQMQKMPKSLNSQMTRKTQWDENEKQQDQSEEKIRPGTVFTEEDEDDSGEDSVQERSIDTVKVMAQKEDQPKEKKEPVTAQSQRGTRKGQPKEKKEPVTAQSQRGTRKEQPKEKKEPVTAQSQRGTRKEQPKEKEPVTAQSQRGTRKEQPKEKKMEPMSAHSETSHPTL